jgi:hypothetical protein
VSSTQIRHARYASRAVYWREQLTTATTPAELFMHSQRWLLALARQAGQSGRRRDASEEAFADAADDAFSEAAEALIEVCRKFEQQIAPGTRSQW